jgi:hypothetical protein
VENVKDYFYLLINQYDQYLKSCPYCHHDHLIRWGYYERRGIPFIDEILIQRVRCTNCLCTTNVLPSFLLANKSYSVNDLQALLLSFISNPDDWKKSPDIPFDLSTAYRWLRIIRTQAMDIMPDIREELLKLKPAHQLFSGKIHSKTPARTVKLLSICSHFIPFTVPFASLPPLLLHYQHSLPRFLSPDSLYFTRMSINHHSTLKGKNHGRKKTRRNRPVPLQSHRPLSL